MRRAGPSSTSDPGCLLSYRGGHTHIPTHVREGHHYSRNGMVSRVHRFDAPMSTFRPLVCDVVGRNRKPSIKISRHTIRVCLEVVLVVHF